MLKMFHVYLRRMYSLLLLDEMFSKSLLDSVDPYCSFKSTVLGQVAGCAAWENSDSGWTP